MNWQPPDPRSDPALFTHAVVVIVIIVCVTVLLALGKVEALSVTPIYGAALGIGGLAGLRNNPPGPPR